MEKDWNVKEQSKRIEMMKNLKFVKFMVFISMAAVVETWLFYTIFQLILVIKFSLSNEPLENSDTKPMYFLCKFLFDVQKSPTFEIVWLGQCLATIITGIIFSDHDQLFIIMVIHLCSQLNVLASDIENLVSESKELTFTRALKAIVRRHLQLKRYITFSVCLDFFRKAGILIFHLRFASNIEKIFNKILLLQMACYTVTLCLQGYQMVVVSIYLFTKEYCLNSFNNVNKKSFKEFC